MSLPSEGHQPICEMFDSYCKKVIKYKSRTIRNRQPAYLGNEVATADPLQYLPDVSAMVDRYPCEQHCLIAGPFRATIHDDALYEGMAGLPEQQRMVLILDFWCEWTDAQIAAHLQVSLRTVYNIRRRAYERIRMTLQCGGE